ncbi:MAG: hypothetical protein A3B25_00530 [Candidatus Ryanbacteria bacterium RIFCSPLOWO2_01_FULL_48_26]|uniref:Type 4 fimbrial biogenesis protein PilX N-terminal domain-containing protein n=1 Tax=Candidatus Ryanbacteria bacterium RIFCSPLOWO2_01_FULL_48_26 TaxID=1802126 RepID=A0A1G2GTQ3_9BACT|nr:MAG: hypothetical protein A3B25_00530 [Candidatus Ryanbacteria bacterium RIFCSPLOWO2_01_FULL_48_26]
MRKSEGGFTRRPARQNFSVGGSLNEDGQTVLPLVLLIGSLIVLIALTLVFLSHTFLISSYGFQISEKAKAVAVSGVYDALIRLARNKDLSGAYALPLGEYSANVAVTQDSPIAGQATITSASTILNRQRKVAAIVSRPSSTGQIILISWQYTQ